MRVTHVITRLIVGGAQENTIASVLGLRLRPGLVFHDGSPLTAEDCAFSFNILKAKGHPYIALPLKTFLGATAEAPDVVVATFAPGRGRDVPLLVEHADHRMLGVLVELGRMGIVQTDHVPAELDRGVEASTRRPPLQLHESRSDHDDPVVGAGVRPARGAR